MRAKILTGALLACLCGLSFGAVVFTADWMSCTTHKGGMACKEPRDTAAGAWVALAMNALALATNVMDDLQP